jgi:hypothetical protein
MPVVGVKGEVMDKQEGFPFMARAEEHQKNAIVIERTDGDGLDFDTLSWVLRARSEDKLRPNLCGLFSDGTGLFVATDGHRMHIAEVPNLTERIPGGIWTFIHADKKKISLREAPEDMALFPNYQLLADPSEEHKDKGCLMLMDEDGSSLVWEFFRLVGRPFNITYLVDAFMGSDAMTVLAAPSEGSAVFFVNELPDGITRKAILMPLKP